MQILPKNTYILTESFWFRIFTSLNMVIACVSIHGKGFFARKIDSGYVARYNPNRLLLANCSPDNIQSVYILIFLQVVSLYLLHFIP